MVALFMGRQALRAEVFKVGLVAGLLEEPQPDDGGDQGQEAHGEDGEALAAALLAVNGGHGGLSVPVGGRCGTASRPGATRHR